MEGVDVVTKLLYFLQDLTLGKMIGSAKEGNDLYYLDIEERGKVRAYQIKETIEGFF